MEAFLENIRRKRKTALSKQIIYTAGILLLGIALGVFSKFLDCTPGNELPAFFEYLDVRNFLGRFAIWLLLGLCIAIYSASPLRAAVNVFTFFTGMVASYYAYSKWIAGFFPQSYALIWVGFTVISPFLAWICWYAKGKGKIAVGISALIIAFLFNESFIYGWLCFDLISILELITFLCGLFVLRRSSVKETILMLAIGIVAALLLHQIVPYGF